MFYADNLFHVCDNTLNGSGSGEAGGRIVGPDNSEGGSGGAACDPSVSRTGRQGVRSFIFIQSNFSQIPFTNKHNYNRQLN